MKKSRLISLNIGVAAILLSLNLNSAVIASDDELEDTGVGTEGDAPETEKPKKGSRFSRLKSKAREAVTKTSSAISKEVDKSSVVKSRKEFAKSAGETIDTGIEFGAKAATIVPRAEIRAGRSIAQRVSGKDKDKEQMEREESPVVEESAVETAGKGRLSRLKESAVGKAISKEIGKSSVLKSGKEFAKSVGDTVDTGIEFGAKAATIVPRAGIRAGRSVARGTSGKIEERKRAAEQAERDARDRQDEIAAEKARKLNEEREERERQIREQDALIQKHRGEEFSRIAAEGKEKGRKLEEARQQAIETEKAKRSAEREERKRAREEARARRHEEKAAKYQEKQFMLQYEQEKRKLEEELRQTEEEERQREPSVSRSKSGRVSKSPLATLEDIGAEVKKLDEDVQKGVVSRKSASEQLKVLTAKEESLPGQQRRKPRRSGNHSISNTPQVESPKPQEHTEPQDVHPSGEDGVQSEIIRSRETGQQIDAKQEAAQVELMGQIKGLGENTTSILKPLGIRLEKERLKNEAAKIAQAGNQEIKENAPPSAEEMAGLRKAAINMIIGRSLKAPKRNQAFNLLDTHEPEDKVIEFLSKNTSRTPEEIKKEIEGQIQQQIKFMGNPYGSIIQQEETPPTEGPAQGGYKAKMLAKMKEDEPHKSETEIEDDYKALVGSATSEADLKKIHDQYFD